MELREIEKDLDKKEDWTSQRRLDKFKEDWTSLWMRMIGGNSRGVLIGTATNRSNGPTQLPSFSHVLRFLCKSVLVREQGVSQYGGGVRIK